MSTLNGAYGVCHPNENPSVYPNSKQGRVPNIGSAYDLFFSLFVLEAIGTEEALKRIMYCGHDTRQVILYQFEGLFQA
jgi:hypothetical protein